MFSALEIPYSLTPHEQFFNTCPARAVREWPEEACVSTAVLPALPNGHYDFRLQTQTASQDERIAKTQVPLARLWQFPTKPSSPQ